MSWVGIVLDVDVVLPLAETPQCIGGVFRDHSARLHTDVRTQTVDAQRETFKQNVVDD